MASLPEPYGSPTAVESAIKAAATKAFAQDGRVSVSERIRRERFRRFLTRVFSDEAPSRWILKGGTGILARVPTARSTTDVDLLWEDHELDSALNELKKLAEADIGDHFRFVYRNHKPLAARERQAHVDGYQVSFDAYLGAKLTGGSTSTWWLARWSPERSSVLNRSGRSNSRGSPATPTGCTQWLTRSPIKFAQLWLTTVGPHRAASGTLST